MWVSFFTKHFRKRYFSPARYCIKAALYLLGGRSPFFPFAIEIILSYKCNIKCAYCYQRADSRSLENNLTFDQIKNIEKNIRSSFCLKPNIYLFGGEPTYAEGFEKTLGYFLDNNYAVTTVTNGLLSEKIKVVAEKTLKGKLAVNISLNYANINSIIDILSIFKNLSQRSNFDIGIHCPVDFLLESKIKFTDILKMFENTCASSVKFLHSKTRASSQIQTLFNEYPMTKNLSDLLKSKSKITYSFVPEIKKSALSKYYLGKNAFKGECLLLPWADMVIQPNGVVVPCEDMQIPLGNVFKEPLSIIWNNEKYRAFRKSVLKNGLTYSGCQYCCHRSYGDAANVEYSPAS